MRPKVFVFATRGREVFKRCLAGSLVLVLIHAHDLHAQSPVQQSSRVTQIKEKVARLGVGKKVTVKMLDGNSLKGPIAQFADEGFVVSDQAQGRDVSAPYSNVKSIKGPRSIVGRIAIWTAVAAGVLLGAVLIGRCNAEDGLVATFGDTATPASYSVTSPKSSNLRITLSWSDPQTNMELQATITDCGGHTGCSMFTSTATGSFPTTLGLQVDGWEGKQYRIDVSGNAATPQPFELQVTYHIACES